MKENKFVKARKDIDLSASFGVVFHKGEQYEYFIENGRYLVVNKDGAKMFPIVVPFSKELFEEDFK